MSTPHRLEIRVRYDECDPMGVAHHSAYLPWFEMGRTELLRERCGMSYRELEAGGALMAVVRVEVRYRGPARYDDLLQLETVLRRVTRARLDHEYRLTRGGALLATASTTVACVDRDGRPRPIPDRLNVAGCV